MSRNSTKVVALPTASVPVGEAGVQPEAGDSFVSSPYVAQQTHEAAFQHQVNTCAGDKKRLNS